MIDLRLHVIPLGNQEIDGTGVPVHRYEVTPAEFAEVLDKVNPYFAPAGIRFVFDPEVDWRPMLDTELNSDGPAMRQRANAMAAGIPGKVLCLLRWGPDPATPTGNGNAYPPPGAGATPRNMFDVTQDYVALPNQYGPNEPFLNLGNGTFLAHELGHYMGLYHTFPGWSDLFGPVYAGQSPAGAAAAQQTLVNYIMANGATIAALDGDGLQDTPPDPSPILFAALGQDYCASPTVNVAGTWNGSPVSFALTPDTSNLMSYFGQCADETPAFSAQQNARMQQTLQHQARRHLTEFPCSRDFHDLPADQFQRCFNFWVNRGYQPVTVSFASHDGALFASGSFQRARGRRVRHLMTATELQAERVSQEALGERPHQVSVVATGDGPRYTAIWGPARGKWLMETELDLGSYAARWHELRADDWVQVDLAITSGSDPRVTAVWEQRPFDDYASYFGMTAQDYQDRFNQFWGSGLKPIRFCRYLDGSAERFAAIWERLPGSWAHYFGMDSASYQTHWEDFAVNRGLRLYQMHSYDRWFAALWHVAGIGRSLGGALTSGPTTTSSGRRQLDVFYRGVGNGLHWMRTAGGPWSRPRSLGGQIKSAPAAVRWGDVIEVLAEGMDGLLYVTTFDGNRWSGWRWVGDALGSAPAACSWGPHRFDVFYRGPGGDLVQRTFAGGWQTPVSLGGGLTSKPAAAAWGPDRLDVFARGTDDALWHTWYDGVWHGWESLGGVLRSAPAACSWGPGRLDVFARGTDDALWHIWFDGAWSGWERLGGVLVSDPAAVSWSQDRIDVFAEGTDGALWRKSWDGLTWSD